MKFSKLALVALSTAAGIRTSGAVTSAPSPAALSFTPFGSGLCADDQNRVFSHIELRQPSIATAAVCSNFCFTNFDHPDLVGFGIDNPDQHCVCYYSGGDVPSFFPPKGSTYVRIVEPGRGPIMSTSIFSQSYDCYVYAKGTGSPTTPGATKAPSTPVPTGTLTAAPTPVGIASHTKIGDGLCQDSAGDLYSFVEFNGNPLSSNDCAQTCGQLPSQDLVGFYFGTLGPTCRCYYSAKNVPAPPLGLDWAIIGTTDKGSGPIKNAITLFGECYAFAQGTGNPTASPTKSPVARPSISPSVSPSATPSKSPTKSPSLSPSTSPTASPSATPSKSPTKTPSLSPSTSPSVSPSATPSKSPTTSPILSPSTSPTASPSANPSKSPTKTPSLSPSTSPTVSPSATPSKSPTKSPSLSPSVAPSESPSATPSKSPTTSPILSPSVSPSASPSAPPSKSPTNSPATSPTATPISAAPTDAPVPFCGAFMGSPCTGPTDFSCRCAGLNCVASNSSPSQFECSDLDDATSPTNPPTNPPTNVASKSGKMSKNAKVTPSPSTAKSNKSTKKVFQD